MRLGILHSGHGFGTKALFALIRTVSRQPVLDVIKLVKYRADFYGQPMGVITQDAMRGPSTWSVGDRELMAAFVDDGLFCRVLPQEKNQPRNASHRQRPGKAGAEPIENGRTTERRQRIHITLANPESEIASVQLTVYGFPVGGRIDPAVAYAIHDGSAAAHNNPAEIHKTIAFNRAVEAGRSASIDVSVQDFSIESSIDLNSATYSDGSSWHPANHRYCQALGVPTGAMPIDGAVTHR